MHDKQAITRIAQLITRYIAQIISRDETLELEKWLIDSHNNQLLFAEIMMEWNIKNISTSQACHA